MLEQGSPKHITRIGTRLCEMYETGPSDDDVVFISVDPPSNRTYVLLAKEGPESDAFLAHALEDYRKCDPKPQVKIVRIPGLKDGEPFVAWARRFTSGMDKEQASSAVREEMARLEREAPLYDWTSS
jgi:hypothetical protein